MKYEFGWTQKYHSDELDTTRGSTNTLGTLVTCKHNSNTNLESQQITACIKTFWLVIAVIALQEHSQIL